MSKSWRKRAVNPDWNEKARYMITLRDLKTNRVYESMSNFPEVGERFDKNFNHIPRFLNPPKGTE